MKVVKKKVVLYGASWAAEKFLRKNKNRYEIEYVIDKGAGRLFHNIPVYTFEEKKHELKDKYVIVTVETIRVYDEIRENLKSAGSVEYINYIFWKQIDRKLAIVYGNCHFDVLTDYLNNNQIFNRKYLIRRCSIIGETVIYPTDEELAECDLLIVQDIRETNYLNVKSADELIAKTSEKATVFKVPNLFGYNLYFPQAKDWRDENLERWGGTEEEWDVDTIVDRIENEDIYEAEDIRCNFAKEIEKIKDREERCDIKISDYILSMYQKIKLFYDPYHPANELIHEKGRRILNKLGIEIDEQISGRFACDKDEMIIYGCVRRSLGLEFKEKLIRKSCTDQTFYGRPVSVKEYVEEYLWWNLYNESI